MIKRELHMSHIRPFIGNDLIKILTGNPVSYFRCQLQSAKFN